MKVRIMAAAAALAVAALGGAATAASAATTPVPGGGSTYAGYNGAMSAAGAYNGAAVTGSGSAGPAYSYWAGFFHLSTSPDTNLCLDDHGWGGQGTKLDVWKCVNQANEQWQFIGSSPPNVLQPGIIESVAHPGLCVNVPGYSKNPATQLILWKCGRAPYIGYPTPCCFAPPPYPPWTGPYYGNEVFMQHG